MFLKIFYTRTGEIAQSAKHSPCKLGESKFDLQNLCFKSLTGITGCTFNPSIGEMDTGEGP